MSGAGFALVFALLFMAAMVPITIMAGGSIASSEGAIAKGAAAAGFLLLLVVLLVVYSFATSTAVDVVLDDYELEDYVMLATVGVLVCMSALRSGLVDKVACYFGLGFAQVCKSDANGGLPHYLGWALFAASLQFWSIGTFSPILSSIVSGVFYPSEISVSNLHIAFAVILPLGLSYLIVSCFNEEYARRCKHENADTVNSCLKIAAISVVVLFLFSWLKMASVIYTKYSSILLFCKEVF